MDKMIQKVMKKGEKVAPVKSIKIKFQKAKDCKSKALKRIKDEWFWQKPIRAEVQSNPHGSPPQE